ncbi:hypothetical protein C4553_00605 [Candidatus Parcubacteria bacterium]|nr:MAG: hypothetical protein C4553_00605 [Candidatus Parcubacteria bacterium]
MFSEARNTNSLIFLSFLVGVFLFAGSQAYAATSATSVPDIATSLESYGGRVYSQTTNSSTISGYFDYSPSTDSRNIPNPPPNSVLVEVGYGSDEHDYHMEVQFGKFVADPVTGAWTVQYTTSQIRSAGGERNGYWVKLEPKDFTGNVVQNAYLTRWRWNSSGTSGGRPGDDSSPGGVCAHAMYQRYDPTTFQLIGSKIEGGNCSKRGYQLNSSWIRGFVTAPPGEFIVSIKNFIFGDDAKMRGGIADWRKLVNSTLNARYVSDNLPTNLSVNTPYSGTMTIRNSGNIVWESDNIISKSGDCSTFDQTAPDPNTECHEYYTVASTDFKLKRLDSSPITITSPMEYRRVVDRKYQWVLIPFACDPPPPPDPCDSNPSDPLCDIYQIYFNSERRFTQKDGLFSIPKAHAQSCDEWSVQVSDTPIFNVTNVAPNDQVDFPISFTTTASAGTYNLQFRMVRSTTNTEFGDIITVPVTVTAPTGTITVNSVNQQTLNAAPSDWTITGPSTFTDSGLGQKTYTTAIGDGQYTFSPVPGSGGPLYTLDSVKAISGNYAKIKREGFSFGFLKDWVGSLARAFDTSGSSCGSNSCWLASGNSVTFQVAWIPEATLDLSPASLNLTGTIYTPNPTGIVSVQNNGAPGSTLNWSISGASQGWLSGSPASGNGVAAGSSQNSTITASISGLSAGTYNGNTVTFAGTSQPGNTAVMSGPKSLTVNLTVNNPAPSITSLNPSNAIAGSGGFTLTVNGNNFVNGSVVRWNGSNRTTTFVNQNQLTAIINAADIASPGTFPVTVFNAAPGGGTSNSVNLTVSQVTADIDANGSDGPITIPYNSAATITWASSNATSCSVAPTGWTGTSGSQSTGNLTSGQTYTLTCTNGSVNVQDIVTVNVQPNSQPSPGTATHTSPGSQPGGWCSNDNNWIINWTFSDTDGDTQNTYQIQIDNSGNTFPSPEIDQTPPPVNTSNSYTAQGLTYNATTYWYRVRVQDSVGQWSGWSNVGSFTTNNNAYPFSDFSWSPVNPGADVVVQFTDQSVCYDQNNNTIACTSWLWNFGDGFTSPDQNPRHIYSASSSPPSNPLPPANYNVSLTSTGGSPTSFSCQATKTINVGTYVPLPSWREVAPL